MYYELDITDRGKKTRKRMKDLAWRRKFCNPAMLKSGMEEGRLEDRNQQKNCSEEESVQVRIV